MLVLSYCFRPHLVLFSSLSKWFDNSYNHTHGAAQKVVDLDYIQMLLAQTKYPLMFSPILWGECATFSPTNEGVRKYVECKKIIYSKICQIQRL